MVQSKRGVKICRVTGSTKASNLPALVRAAIPEIDGHETIPVMHNHAVVQGLSEMPFVTDVKHWGVMTIGTGLGNARFSNRRTIGAE
jgi:hypothetical protein